nr:reverse transcriptase domain-containing protein [Tanacetum cinerariifolium]
QSANKCCDFRHDNYSQTVSSNSTSSFRKNRLGNLCYLWWCSSVLSVSRHRWQHFPELKDNIQGYVAAATINYNQGNSVYRSPIMANQIQPSGFAQPNVQNNQNWFSQTQGYNQGNNFNQDQSYQAPTQQNQSVPLSELEKVKRMNEANIKAMKTQINNMINELRNEMKNSIQASMSNQTNELKNMMASFFQMNTASTSGYKDLLRACPHHGFIKLHQLDTFYNALNPTDQDSLNSTAGGNLLERRTQDVLTIIENKSKVCNSRNKSVVSQVKSSDANSNSSSKIAKLTHAVNQQTNAVTTAMTTILKQFQATPPPASVKTV